MHLMHFIQSTLNQFDINAAAFQAPTFVFDVSKETTFELIFPSKKGIFWLKWIQ